MIPQIAVENIRYGLATNSSSTHSIIHNTQLSDKDLVGYEYGWENFTLASREEKKKYLLQQLRLTIGKEKELLFLSNELDWGAEEFLEGYIDHESVLTFPKDIYGELNIKFFKEYYNYLLDNSFVILGGDNNSDDGHPNQDDDDGLLPVYNFYRNDIAYKNGNYWIVQNSTRKLRINFTQNPIKADTPELLDVKLTNRCLTNCAYCYQDSTKDGLHGDTNYIKAIIEDTYSKQVEFALGGGEPTDHPDFVKILNYIKRNKNIANFTTKSLTWFNNPEIVAAVNESVSGIAYSPDTINHMKQFIEAHDKHVPKIAIYFHIIPELLTRTDLKAILDYIQEVNSWQGNKHSRNNRIKLTMLGYKQIGRATKPITKILDLIEFLQTYSNIQIGIDTKIAQDYANQLATVSNRLYTTHEGEFSMYIDAVTQKAYKSSYDLDHPVDTVKKTSDSWDGKSKRYTLHRATDIFKEIK